MWEILNSNADQDCSKTLALPEILKTQNRLRVESCASLAVTRLFPWDGCVRNRLQSHTVWRKLKLFLLMHVCAWMEFPLLISGIWWLKCFILPPTKYRNTQSTTNTHSSQGESQLYIFEDKEAVIKMIMKRRSQAMRHVSGTHTAALDGCWTEFNLEPKIKIKYVDTKNQLADMLTKESFPRDEWNHLLRLFNIMHFSMFSCSHLASFFLIRSESRAPCQREVRIWQSQNKRFQRRWDQWTWFCTARGARGKILLKTWDIPSIRGMTIKDKVI